MKELIVATKNKHKVKEIQEKLSSYGYRVVSLLDMDDIGDIVEDKTTFEGNALKKATVIHSLTKKIVLADDSGLCVDALNGAPGVYSARFAGNGSTDEENNKLLLEKLQTVEQRDAHFVTVMVLVGYTSSPIITRGYLQGSIAKKPRGDGGFGYDPVFVLKNTNRHLSEYTMEEKNEISHRAKALEQMIEYLK